MDAGLDSNRKVMQAGRNGRDVFLFLLRRCSWNNAPGRLKLTEIDPWFVVQVEKMMTEAEVVEGTERAIAAGLIEIADGMVWIVGWEEEWGKRPQTATERKQKERAIKKTTAAEKQMQLTDVTTMSQRSRRERENRSEIRNTHVSVSDRPDGRSATSAPLERVQGGAPPDAAPTPPPAADAAHAHEPPEEPGWKVGEWRAMSPHGGVPIPPPDPATLRRRIGSHLSLVVPVPPPPSPRDVATPQQVAWWGALLAELRRVRGLGVQPDAEDFAPSCAGTALADVRACERNLAASGYDEIAIDRKFRHVIALRGAQAHKKRSFEHFKPSVIFDPDNFARACDMGMAEATAGPPAPRAGKTASSPAAIVPGGESARGKPAMKEMSADDLAFMRSMVHAVNQVGYEAAHAAATQTVLDLDTPRAAKG